MQHYVIIEDEPKNMRVLRKMLDDYCPQIIFAGQASNTKEGEILIQKAQPELVFLDIEMPFGNTFDMLDRLMPIRFEVIFVTAFDNYTLMAFKYSALDYLLKPISIDELCAAVQKASEKWRLKNINQQLQNLLANLRQPEVSSHKLALPNAESLVFITVDDIIRCEARGGYTVFFMKDGEKILSTKPIKDYEEVLPPSIFCGYTVPHIVNLLCIRKYHRGRGGYIEMEGQVMIEVSTRRKNEFLNRFGF